MGETGASAASWRDGPPPTSACSTQAVFWPPRGAQRSLEMSQPLLEEVERTDDLLQWARRQEKA